MHHYHFFYQPSPILAVIDGCWTLIILLTGIIFWLEVTHFQWITLLFFVAFFVMVGLEVFCRQLVIQGHSLKVLSFIHYQWRTFNLRSCSFQVTDHQLMVKDGRRTFSYLISYPSSCQIRQLLSKQRSC